MKTTETLSLIEQLKRLRGSRLNDAPYEIFTLNHNPEKTDSQYYKLMIENFDLNVEDVIYGEFFRQKS